MSLSLMLHVWSNQIILKTFLKLSYTIRIVQYVSSTRLSGAVRFHHDHVIVSDYISQRCVQDDIIIFLDRPRNCFLATSASSLCLPPGFGWPARGVGPHRLPPCKTNPFQSWPRWPGMSATPPRSADFVRLGPGLRPRSQRSRARKILQRVVGRPVQSPRTACMPHWRSPRQVAS